MNRARAPRPGRQTLRALDATNFLMADTVTGVGPFLAIYLAASLHWNPEQIGIAMLAAGIAGLVAQTPIGALVDPLRYKREAIALGAALVGLGCLTTVFFHAFAEHRAARRIQRRLSHPRCSGGPRRGHLLVFHAGDENDRRSRVT
jgi:predicted MFS family arabinose efflux permease